MTVLEAYLISEDRDELFRKLWLPRVIDPVEYVESRDIATDFLREMHVGVYLCGPRHPAFLATLPRVGNLINTCITNPDEVFLRELYEISQQYENLHYYATTGPEIRPVDSVTGQIEYSEINRGKDNVTPHLNVWGIVRQPHTPETWPETSPGDIIGYARKWHLDERDIREVIDNYFGAYIMQDIFKGFDATRQFQTAFVAFLNRWGL